MSAHIIPNITATRPNIDSPVGYIACVMCLLEQRGDPIAEDELIALTGVGLAFLWRPDTPCDEVSLIPEIPACTFDALGYASEMLTRETHSREQLLEGIIESIDAGRPAIGFGLATPEPYACLIVGYDEGGLYTSAPASASAEYTHVADWYARCAGVLLVGEKTGERLTGRAAYERVAEWALAMRRTESMTVGEQQIPVCRAAFPAMRAWLTDGPWETDEHIHRNEAWLIRYGLQPLAHCRSSLYSYLWRLNAEHPGVVHLPALVELERIARLLGESPIPDPFAAMGDSRLRERVAQWVAQMEECDNSLQWTLFMPGYVQRQLRGIRVESFEYLEFSALRFIGAEGDAYDDPQRRIELMARLDAMSNYRSGFDYDVLFLHHNGRSADTPVHKVWGRFMRAGAPVPDGLSAIDLVPYDVAQAGPPYYSRFAYARFSGGAAALHAHEGYDVDAMYDITRNTILGDGVNIPYPAKYWTAEVFDQGCDRPGSAYLFSTGAREAPRRGIHGPAND